MRPLLYQYIHTRISWSNKMLYTSIMWKTVALLFILTALIEAAFTGVYYYQATGPLAPHIAAHTASLESGIIPAADSIDIRNDPWVKVAHFESTFYQVRFIVDLLMGVLITVFVMLSGISATLWKKAKELSPNIHLSRALYLTMLVTLLALINIPLSFSDFLINTLRGTSFIPVEGALFAFVQDVFLGILFTLIPFVPLYFIIEKFKERWWMIGALFMSLVMVSSAFISPVLIDPLYYDVTPLEHGPVREALADIVATAGVPEERIFVSNASASTFESNAIVTGLGTTKRIILDDTLITFYTPEEIRVIVAHELGHYVMHHLWYDIALGVVLTFITYFGAAYALRWFVHRYGKHFHATHAHDIVLYPILSTLLFVIPLLTSPLDSYVSRSFEHQADVYETAIARDPQASIDGFKKMTYQSFIDVEPSPFLQFWFGIHPSVAERIEYYESQK